MNAKKKITKDLTIHEALALGNDAFEVLAKYFGPGCLACGAAAFETLEMGCLSHGLPDEKISELVTELQAIADKSANSSPKK